MLCVVTSSKLRLALFGREETTECIDRRHQKVVRPAVNRFMYRKYGSDSSVTTSVHHSVWLEVWPNILWVSVNVVRRHRVNSYNYSMPITLKMLFIVSSVTNCVTYKSQGGSSTEPALWIALPRQLVPLRRRLNRLKNLLTEHPVEFLCIYDASISFHT